ncbi:unnamed protein product, partial [Allacma fusca]
MHTGNSKGQQTIQDHVTSLEQWRLEMNAVIDALRRESTGLKNQVAQLTQSLGNAQNPPSGFIYVQLPGQVDPNILWPTARWYDISQTYAGLFFRVLGGNSGHFGSLQYENTPRIDRIYTKNYDRLNPPRDSKLEPGRCALVGSGGRGGGWTGIDLCTSGGEIRPTNKAVKIWTRR